MTRNRKLKRGITKRMKQFWTGMARGTLRLSNQHTENAAPGDQPPVSVVSHENIPEKWNRGGILMRNPGQGDCLFHALVQALAEQEPGKKALTGNFVLSR